MIPAIKRPDTTDAWKSLQHAASTFSERSIRGLFSDDAQRYSRFTMSVPGLLLDFSKQRMDADVVGMLGNLAQECHFSEWRAALFDGKEINHSEERAAGHWRLRAPEKHPAVAAEMAKMERIVARVRSGNWRGIQGDIIEDVVNLGVGGSELGPLLVSTALREHGASAATKLRVHFVSSMDGGQLEQTLRELDPRKTLFIVSSKSFSTVDTLSNAAAALDWLGRYLPAGEPLLRCHFIGISAHADRMSEWGIPADNQLQLWDWVGGRFSLWSATGLPIALSAGMDAFRQLLAGAQSMDQHFLDAPLDKNLPLMLALVDIWNVNFLGIGARAVLPYDSRLRGLPVYLEQLEMESNGKSMDREGNPVSYQTCPVIWGEVGPNAQHAFYQLLHQGTQSVACEFVAVAARRSAGVQDRDVSPLDLQHRLSLVNCLAQSRLLALGDEVSPDVPSYMHYRGDRPCTTVILDDLTPFNLGALIAAYEHKVFSQAVIWGINPFDQWGVERGKSMARELLPLLQQQAPMDEGIDSSTKGLLAHIQSCLGARD